MKKLIYFIIFISGYCFSQNYTPKGVIKSSTDTAINIGNFNNKPSMIIKFDGTVFWKDHEVKSDEEFRKAMIDVRNLLSGQYHCTGK